MKGFFTFQRSRQWRDRFGLGVWIKTGLNKIHVVVLLA
jgi:hypothetical protein